MDTLLKQTIVLMEDQRFYSHCGIDPFAIMRAIAANFKAGRRAQGGSTITQQLARTLYLTPKKSYIRKLREAFIALKMEFTMTKTEIFDLYIASAYMGPVRGFHKAAVHYFNKDLNELSLLEMVSLVAMLPGPKYYQPQSEAGKKRQIMILSSLLYTGKITIDQFKSAIL